MERANIKCKMSTKNTKSRKNFELLHFAICCIHEVAFGEFVNTRVYRKAQKGYVRKNDERNPQRGRYVAETDKR